LGKARERGSSGRRAQTRKEGTKLRVDVRPGTWGSVSVEDVQVVLCDAALQINSTLRQPLQATVTVIHAPDTNPQVLVHSSRRSWYWVQLSAEDRRWAQYAYQFSHEFCHIIVDPYAETGWNHQWFAEALCETASVFVLRRMAKVWTIQPPYPHWRDYAPHLNAYADGRITDADHALPPRLTLPEWIASEEQSLIHDAVTKGEQRKKFSIIAYAILPALEAYPSGWNAIRELPIRYGAEPGSIGEYLQQWHAAVDPADQDFASHVIRILTDAK